MKPEKLCERRFGANRWERRDYHLFYSVILHYGSAPYRIREWIYNQMLLYGCNIPMSEFHLAIILSAQQALYRTAYKAVCMYGLVSYCLRSADASKLPTPQNFGVP